MNYALKLTHTSKGGIVSTELVRIQGGYGEARAELAAIIRNFRQTRRYYVVRDGRNQFYFSSFDGLLSTVATIRYGSDELLDIARERMERFAIERILDGAAA